VKLETALIIQLSQHGALNAMIAGRVYPVTYPQGATMPLVVYQQTGKAPDYTHDGEGGSVESRFQISAFGDSFGQAKSVAAKIHSALRPWMASQVKIEDLTIGAVRLENEFDLHNPDDVEHSATYQVLGDYVFLHSEDD